MVLVKILLGDVENLCQVYNLADGENAPKRIVGPSVILEGVDEQGPIELSVWLGKDSCSERIG